MAVLIEDNTGAASVSINQNNFANLSIGVAIKMPVIVDATSNWWGHASGPSGEFGRINKKGKIIGKGCMVGPFVNWDPYLHQPINHTKHNPLPPGLL